MTMDAPQKGGFSFDVCRRNDMLSKKGMNPPKYRKTGTTIVGMVFQDGVILGADTRATAGPIVCDKNCEKIHYIAPNIYCCGAGTAADTEAVTGKNLAGMAEEEYKVNETSPVVEGKNESVKRRKDKRRNLLPKEIENVGEELEVDGESLKDEEEQGINEMIHSKEENLKPNDRKEDIRKKKRKDRLLKEAAEAGRRGICYLSRIPPHMDHVKLRHILAQYGDILRIYLVPEDPAARVHRKKAGGFRGQGFSEGWVEFTDKRVAKRVSDMLNGEQFGGKKRSQFYYDLWNIKFLSKFKWDDITEEIAFKNASRQQKLELEISAAKRERDMVISNVERAIAKTHIEERLKKKQKVGQDSVANSDIPVNQQAGNPIRHLMQKKPFADKARESKRGLSKETLAGIFGGSS